MYQFPISVVTNQERDTWLRFILPRNVKFSTIWYQTNTKSHYTKGYIYESIYIV